LTKSTIYEVPSVIFSNLLRLFSLLRPNVRLTLYCQTPNWEGSY